MLRIAAVMSVILLNSVSAFAAGTGPWASADTMNLENFGAPIVNSSSNYTNQLPFGSIVYDASTDQFKGLDRNGTWDAMSFPAGNPNVTSTSTGNEHIERAHVDSTCTSSPCTMTSNTPGISSITGTGQYTVNFTAGTFNIAPTCSILNGNTSGVVGNRLSASTTTSAMSFLTINNVFANLDIAFDVLCMGSH